MDEVFSWDSFLNEIDIFHAQDINDQIELGIKEKKPSMGFVFGLVSFFSRFAIFNFFMIQFVIVFYNIYRVPRNGFSVLLFDPRSTNRAVVDRFYRIFFKKGYRFDVNGKKAPLSLLIKRSMRLKAIWSASICLKKNSNRRGLCTLQRIIGFASFVVFWGEMPKTLKVICVASDISPVCMALLKVARLKKVKTCYLQHAPVTDLFPPLNFDLSVLFDEISIEHYFRSSDIKGSQGGGRVVILPPFDSNFSEIKIKSGVIDVGLCLSFLFNAKSVSSFIKSIGSSDRVNKIIIRRHPRCRADLSFLEKLPKVAIEEAGRDLSCFVRDSDIVLAPNSGVIVELLHRGKPTFYLDDLDLIPYDYYGFVANGVVPVFTKDTVENVKEACDFFDASWMSSFASYDGTVKRKVKDCEGRVLESFLPLIE